MNTLVQAYYAARSERYGVALPAILRGARLPLLWHPDIPMPLQRSHRAASASREYGRTVAQVGAYLLDILWEGLDEEARASAAFATEPPMSAVNGAISKLLPSARQLTAGHIDNLYVEAVAGQEIDAELLATARKGSKGAHEGCEDTEAYLVVSGDLHATAHLGTCAVLGVVGYRKELRRGRTVYSTQVRHAAFPGNADVARSALVWQRATRTASDEPDPVGR